MWHLVMRWQKGSVSLQAGRHRTTLWPVRGKRNHVTLALLLGDSGMSMWCMGNLHCNLLQPGSYFSWFWPSFLLAVITVYHTDSLLSSRDAENSKKYDGARSTISQTIRQLKCDFKGVEVSLEVRALKAVDTICRLNVNHCNGAEVSVKLKFWK